ncbi:MAG TPA: carboxymuconolactone decarboxylase family protein [Phenylobacterium sp.]|nr:carboxymuconolactone decarboxylase family protein [Phenylobacterium sp.]
MTLTAGGAASAEDRFPRLAPDAMTPAQRQVADAITSGPRKSLGGPFNAWLRSPELADRLQKVGEHLRFHSSVPRRLNEFAILITARAWNADYEWYAHYPMALQAGLRPQIAEQLARGERPAGMASDESTIYDFVTELRREKRVSEATFARAKDLLGDQGVVDLIAVAGYYDLVSMTLNVAQVKPPEPGPLPLPPLEGAAGSPRP